MSLRIRAACLGCSQPMEFDIESALELGVMEKDEQGTTASITCDDCEPLLAGLRKDQVVVNPFTFRHAVGVWHDQFILSDDLLDLAEREQFDLFLSIYRGLLDATRSPSGIPHAMNVSSAVRVLQLAVSSIDTPEDEAACTSLAEFLDLNFSVRITSAFGEHLSARGFVEAALVLLQRASADLPT